MSGRRLLLWRHGRTEWNASGRMQGQSDVALDATGIQQAREVAPLIAAEGPDAIVSSDLVRAQDTALALGSLLELPVATDPRLRESDFGPWQGLTAVEISERYPDEYARWQAGEEVDGCGVEELDDLAQRAGEAFQDAAALAPDATVLAFCHGGTAKYGVAALLGWPAQVWPTIGPMGNCRWIELRRDTVRGWQLRGYNLGGS